MINEVGLLWRNGQCTGKEMSARMDKPAIAGGTPVRETKLYYGHQYIDEADVKAVAEVLVSEALTCG